MVKNLFKILLPSFIVLMLVECESKQTKQLTGGEIIYEISYPCLEKNEESLLFLLPKKMIMTFLNDQFKNEFIFPTKNSSLGLINNSSKKDAKLLFGLGNNKKYTSIGRFLVKENLIEKRNVNLFTIKNFLRNNPDKIKYILNQNERYIFFKIANESLKNPLGALGMELIPFISIAIDKKHYPLGMPFLLYEETENSYKIVLGMDTGYAIKGKNRADLFTGSGEKAKNVAGMMKNKLILYSLVPY